MAPAAPLQPAAAHQGVLARHPLLFYFIIAYAGTWLLSVPLALSEAGVGLLPFSSPLLDRLAFAGGPFAGPFLAAFVLTGATEGREGVSRLLRRFVLWRVGLGWYLFVLLGVPLIFTLTTVLLPGAAASFKGLATLAPLPLLGLFVYIFFLGGPLGEEPGWRGFALPRLQRLYGPLVGSLILGPLWALWHLPLFFIVSWDTPPTILNFVLYISATTAMTILFTWVFNNTKGSLLIAILMHTAINLSYATMIGLFPTPLVTDYGTMVPMVIGFGAVALVVIALTRGRLGYQHYRQEEVEPDSAAAPT
jgi:membrane protease YdiL (CAAX protease family)